MAEFQEVMRQLNRMCSHYLNCDESGCPLFDECGNIGSYSSNAKQAVRIETTVLAWAEEYPVVYPTWGEWLLEQGIVCAGTETRNGFTYQVVNEKFFAQIDADTAQKLGIEPKEG